MSQDNINKVFSEGINTLFECNHVKGHRINQLEKSVNFLSRQDRTLALSLICLGISVVITAKEVKRLHKEVEELKRMKGE